MRQPIFPALTAELRARVPAKAYREPKPRKASFHRLALDGRRSVRCLSETGALGTAHATATRLNPLSVCREAEPGQSFLHRDEVEGNATGIIDDGIGSAET